MLEEIIAPLLTTEWGRRGGLAAVIFFSLCLLMTLIEMPITWYKDYQLVHPKIAAKVETAPDQTMALIMKLPDQHVFGASETALPITSLQLHLIGVIEANPESASSVIISEAGQPGKIYQMGDSVASGVKIKTITRDGVILENGGRMEKLPLSRPPLTFQGMPKNILPGE